ncbi:CDP-diacylglycerol--glycerol-3-phosphate 3-phosphatidyltransferase [Salinibacterium sp. PAMC 21357]|uniref:CDP-diacylglycerol--glycerol-3-phosphate 3-phosphatidyltransferase n=1 Tax=Salinibacterium sp. PAMC 21357 TaxID=1112215 RepID=UPI000288C600
MSDQPVSPSAPPKRTSSMRGRMIRKGDTPASNANIANIITVVRIFLAPLFIWLLLLDDSEMGLIRYLAAGLFIFAIVTDAVDGHLARGRNLITNVGIILDPIADKVLTGGALVALSILGELPWWVTILILVREFGITIYRFAVLSKVVVPASRGGKLKTVLQAVAISLYLVPLSSVLGSWVSWINWSVMTVAVVLTVYTGIEYLWQARRHTRKLNPGA